MTHHYPLLHLLFCYFPAIFLLFLIAIFPLFFCHFFAIFPDFFSFTTCSTGSATFFALLNPFKQKDPGPTFRADGALTLGPQAVGGRGKRVLFINYLLLAFQMSSFVKPTISVVMLYPFIGTLFRKKSIISRFLSFISYCLFFIFQVKVIRSTMAVLTMKRKEEGGKEE